MSRTIESALLLIVASGLCGAAPRYDGPRPPQPDLPYLLHANNLVPTEKVTAREESGKNGMSYVIAGSSSSARTPLAEPIFIIQAQRLVPDRLGCFRMDVNKSGNREVVMGKKEPEGQAHSAEGHQARGRPVQSRGGYSPRERSIHALARGL